MIGPFDVLTTARSGERAGGAGAAGADPSPGSAFFCDEHPVSSALAEAARTACPNSRRLRAAGVSFLRGAGPHDPHPFGVHVPHAVPVLPMTFNIFSIALSPFHAGCSFGSWHVTTLLIDRLEGERMARTRLVQSSLMTALYQRLGERLSPLALLRDVGVFNVRVLQRERELAKLAVTAQHGSSADETSGNKCRYSWDLHKVARVHEFTRPRIASKPPLMQ